MEHKESLIDKTKLQRTAELLIDNVLNRNGFMWYHVDTVHGIHYAETCTSSIAMHLAHIFHDEDRLEKLITRYSIKISVEEKEGFIHNTRNHVDVNVYGIIPLEIYLHTSNEFYLEQGLALAEEQWENPCNNGLSKQSRYWIDDMFMIGILQLKSYEVTGDKKYLERTALTVNNYLEKLQKENGLFYHGQNAPFFWGRGNGWCAAAMALIIRILPEENEYYISIKNGYLKMMKTLMEYQGKDGMWKQLIDCKDAWSESSCTAMFAYAIHEGIKAGLLKETDYKYSVTKAWKSLLKKTDKDGNLEDICTGTGQSTERNYYLERPRVTGDLHGQAFMLYLINSLLET